VGVVFETKALTSKYFGIRSYGFEVLATVRGVGSPPGKIKFVSIGIMGLARNSRQIFEFKRLIRTILRNKHL